jgi:hypothetical protein
MAGVAGNACSAIHPHGDTLSHVHSTFADMLATLRWASVRRQVVALVPSGPGSRKLARLLEHAVAMASSTAKVEASRL